ncbi:MAG: hypothetical protein ACXVBE_17940 [Bdellovibrionota bacterium]
MKFLSLAILTLTLSQPAFAESFVECGTSVDRKANTVSGRVLHISSDSEEYTGPLSKKKWTLSMGADEDKDVEPTKDIVAETTEKNHKYNITISFLGGQYEGMEYRIIDAFGDAPKMNRYSRGKKSASYECQSDVD